MSYFLGRGWSFPPRFDTRGQQLTMVSEVEDIEESLRILMATTPGERVMQPAYGCGLRRYLFEAMNEQTLTAMKDAIRKAILFFEPRIRLNRIEVRVPDPLEGRLELLLDYSVRTTNTRHNLVYPLYLHQATRPIGGT